MRGFVILTLAIGCGTTEDAAESESESEGEPDLAAVLVTSTDAVSGAISAIDMDTLEVQALVEPTASGDVAGRAWFGRYFVVNRLGSDSVQVHDPADGLALLKEFSVGSTTDNAQDICCVSPDKCYVTRLQAPDLLVVNPNADEEIVASIDLGDLADDGNPNPQSCGIAGTKLLVALQNLDDADPYLTPMAPGWVVVIDTQTDAPVATAQTLASNPSGRFVVEPGGATALVGEIGAWSALDGGVARIDTATGAEQGFAVTEAALGGDVSRVVRCPGGETFAIATRCDAEFNCSTALLPFDAASGAVGEPTYDPDAFALTWVAADNRGRLWVAERNLVAGVHGIWLFGCDGSRLTDTPLDVGLPPAWEGVIEFVVAQ